MHSSCIRAIFSVVDGTHYNKTLTNLIHRTVQSYTVRTMQPYTHTHEQQQYAALIGRCSPVADCQTAFQGYKTVRGASRAEAPVTLAQLAGCMHTIPACYA